MGAKYIRRIEMSDPVTKQQIVKEARLEAVNTPCRGLYRVVEGDYIRRVLRELLDAGMASPTKDPRKHSLYIPERLEYLSERLGQELQDRGYVLMEKEGRLK
jgi:hypothetical protein